MVKRNTICIPLIRDDLINRCLETLYRYTPDNFYVYLIDQTLKGIDANYYRDKFKNLMVIRTPKTDIHYTGNLGFAKAFNTGLKLCETEYYTTCNDDVEFINKGWWEGVKKTFDKVDKATPERPCAMVTPSSLKLPDWSVGRDKGDDFYILPYKKNYTQEDWEFLVNEPHYINQYLTIKPDTVIDGVTFYCSIFKKKYLDKIGWLSEAYFPGSGEDYSWCCRSNMVGYRSVGTTLSWIFHHWSQTFKSLQEQEEVKQLLIPELAWNGTSEEFGEGFDLWGVKCPKCGEAMRCGDDKTIATCSNKHEEYRIPPPSKIPL